MDLGGEVIQLHVGQAGIQIANACWELYCLEHGINTNGCITGCDYTFNTFFSCAGGGKVVPRLVMVDSEPTVIDEIRTGSYRNLFHPSTLISGRDDCGNNFARGYNQVSDEMSEAIYDTIRLVSEACSNLQGFILFRSLGGGTGSGLGAKILEFLSTNYPKTCTLEYNIFPSPTLSSAMVEPYNAILSTHTSLDHSSCSFTMDNEALYDICEKKLKLNSPTFTNLNRIIGQVVSAFTAALRFEGAINVKFREFETNLVPFPRIQFPLVSYAPLSCLHKGQYENYNVNTLTNQVFEESSQMLKCNPKDGKYFSTVFLYRGDVGPGEINLSIARCKERFHNFVDWAPANVKVGVNYMPPTCIPWGDITPTNRACLLLANNSCIKKVWCRLLQKFDIMFQRKAYVYHYVGEGLEESTLEDAKNNVNTLIHGYDEIEVNNSQLFR